MTPNPMNKVACTGTLLMGLGVILKMFIIRFNFKPIKHKWLTGDKIENVEGSGFLSPYYNFHKVVAGVSLIFEMSEFQTFPTIC